ncbi:MAG: TraM recognition domain-containing protein, partial [Aureliella sp.]
SRAKFAQRKIRVQVVIDEFQRMISDNLDIVFQQARSLNIGMMIANQSMGDLRNAGPVLLSAIEGNCAIRQWLSVNTADDIEHLTKLFGSYKKVHEKVTESPRGRSVSRELKNEPRITTNNLQQISDDPFLSVVQIDGERHGFARYRGVPFVLRNSFHISDQEYRERLKFQWPTHLSRRQNKLTVPKPTLLITCHSTNYWVNE